MVRSSNGDPVQIPNVTATARAVAVVFAGSALSSAWVLWRARFNCLSVNAGATVRISVRLPRVASQTMFLTYALPALVIGDKIEVYGVCLADLLAGDLIELGLASGTTGIWELESQGFTVDFR